MTVNVGAEVHRVTGRPTVLVDLKHGPGDIALFLGLRPRQTLTHVLDRLAWREPALVLGCLARHACGVDVLAAGDDWSRPAARDAEGVEATLACLRQTHDFVLVDAGSMPSVAVAAALQAADLVVLVANPDVACLQHLPRLIDAVRLTGVSGDRMRILLNRASEAGIVSAAQIEQVLGVPIDWSVPSDYRTMAAAMTAGEPVRGGRGPGVQPHLEQVARGLAGAVGQPPAAGSRWSIRAPSRPGIRDRDPGGDAAAGREVALDGHPPRLAGGDQVVEDLVGRRFVEDAAVAVLEEVALSDLSSMQAAAGV